VAQQEIAVETLRETLTEILLALGAPSESAVVVAASLALANQVGHDSHGAVRILEYASFVERGVLVPSARPVVAGETGAVVTVDGGGGWGQVAAHFAVDRAIESAERAGVGVVSIRNCNHIGRLGEYVEAVAARGLVALMWCNADPAVAPFGGRERRLGTNPIAIGIPVGGDEPFVLDFATAAVAEGKLRVARAAGERVPEGLVIDAEGRPSTDPQAFYDGGALLPFGGHKGYGLSLAVELLGGALSGNHPSVTERYAAGNGVVLIALRPEAFAGTTYDADVADTVADLRATAPTVPGRPVLVPGDVERAIGRNRSLTVPVVDGIWDDVLALRERLATPGAPSRR
jgi:uncharacterized oxidoreductase